MAELMEAPGHHQLEQQQPQPALHDDSAVPPQHDAAGAANTNTSVRYLRLQHDFSTMIKSGLDCIDEQAFVELFGGRAAPHQLRHTWRLLQQQCDSVVAEACAELGVACAEVGLQQQLEELEGLILQRGLLGGTAGSGSGDGSAADPAALPAAAEAAARVAAKRAEKQQLMSTLQQLQQQKALLEADLVVRQQQAEELVRDFKAVEDQVDKVYRASKTWLQPAAAGGDGDA